MKHVLGETASCGGAVVGSAAWTGAFSVNNITPSRQVSKRKRKPRQFGPPKAGPLSAESPLSPSRHKGQTPARAPPLSTIYELAAGRRGRGRRGANRKAKGRPLAGRTCSCYRVRAPRAFGLPGGEGRGGDKEGLVMGAHVRGKFPQRRGGVASHAGVRAERDPSIRLQVSGALHVNEPPAQTPGLGARRAAVPTQDADPGARGQINDVKRLHVIVQAVYKQKIISHKNTQRIFLVVTKRRRCRALVHVILYYFWSLFIRPYFHFLLFKIGFYKAFFNFQELPSLAGCL